MRRKPFIALLTGLSLTCAGIAGTAPAAPQLDRVEGNNLRLWWPTFAGHEYDLQESRELIDWESVAGYPVEATGRPMHHQFAPETDGGFFRVLDLGPPVLVPQLEAFFSVAGPTGTEEDLTLEEKLKELLRLAEPGSEVRVALYTWSRGSMADAFIEAFNRGVDVRLIVGSDYAAVRKLEENIPHGRVLVCRDEAGVPNGCHGGRINHNKFFLFSELSDGSRDVVVQSSANFTNPQIRNNNNIVVSRNDASLYNAYHIYWNDLFRQVEDLSYYWDTGEESSPCAWFFPRQGGDGTTGSQDTIVEILDEVRVASGSQIHLAMAIWTDARIAIANRLVALKAAGVDVRVIVNPNNTGAKVRSALVAGGIPVTEFAPLHSKYMLIEHGLGRRHERLVYTGSHNYTDPALRSNDEALLRIDDFGIYETFLQDWYGMLVHPLAE